MDKQNRRERAMPGIRYKLQRLETKALDNHRIEAVLSTEASDRDGDIIRVQGWELDNFMAHPILLSSHDYFSLRSQIGEWEDVKKTTRGGVKMLLGIAKYYVDEGNEEADWGYALADKGRAAYSVGFIPDFAKAKEIEGLAGAWGPSYEFNGQELLETSHVTVPSNPQALQRMKGTQLHPDIAQIVNEIIQDHGDSDEDTLLALAALPGRAVELNHIADTILAKIDPRLVELETLFLKTLHIINQREAKYLARIALSQAVKEALLHDN